MPHGRSEEPIPNRVAALAPDKVVVLERGSADNPALVACNPEAAVRALVTSTYMAGELRRYWAFAALLSAGTGRGPAHPPIADVASAFAQHLPCFSLILGKTPMPHPSQALQSPEVAA